MKPSSKIHVTVIGDGGWGTALSLHALRCGHTATLWGAFPDYIEVLQEGRENVKYLPGFELPKRLQITADLGEAVKPADLILLAVPAQYMRGVTQQLKQHEWRGKALVNVAKGIEQDSLQRMSEVIRAELSTVDLASLSGPSIAKEVAAGLPASVVVASKFSALAKKIQAWLMNEQLRIYTSHDLVGVELGGALKNPLAIAAGIADGLGLGTNAKAALLARGVVEMARLGTVLGAQKETFVGLSGMGDLVTTCLAGRNHWLGQQIGQGKTLKQALAMTPCVIEGVDTSKSAGELARKHGVEMPIVEQVKSVLFDRRSPKKALQELMTRTGKVEALR